ncbi:MAG: hypothetical protein AAF530_13020 [Pseudomonadota bacterium]
MWVKSLVLVGSLAALSAACTPVSKEEQTELAKPVDCSTAEGDMRVLKSEKDTVAQRLADGVTAIAPAGLVVGSLRGVEGEKLKVATGDYNGKIDQKIADIKSACNID